MPTGDALADDHLLLRRFDPNNASHCVRDEGTGLVQLRQNAFVWDSEEDERIGFSVYDDAILVAHGLKRALVVDAIRTDIAGATVRQVKTVGAAGDSFGPFAPEEDAYPDGPVGASPADAAHSVVWRPRVLANRRRLLVDLAAAFVPIGFERIAV